MDPILKKRYPDGDSGDLMEQVCPSRRALLYAKAREVSEVIVDSARAMRKGEVAVILFGSVAKALVRRDGHEDPSNIDIATIGNFSRNDRDILFESIRPVREKVAAEIGNNVGVFVQDREAVCRNNFDTVYNYIGSCARPLFDAYGIWQDLEAKALSEARFQSRFKNGNHQPRLIRPVSGKKS